MAPIQSVAIPSEVFVRVFVSDLAVAMYSPSEQKKESQGCPSCVGVRNLSVNPLLTKSGRARPSFKAILHLSSLSALRLSLLATALGEGGVLLAGLEERVDVQDAVAEEDVGARLEGKIVLGGGFCAATGCGFEVVDRETVLSLFVEGDRTLTVFLGSGVFGSEFDRSFVGVTGVNQSAYS